MVVWAVVNSDVGQSRGLAVAPSSLVGLLLAPGVTSGVVVGSFPWGVVALAVVAAVATVAAELLGGPYMSSWLLSSPSGFWGRPLVLVVGTIFVCGGCC